MLVPHRRRHQFYHLAEHRRHIGSILGGNTGRVLGWKANYILDLLDNKIRLGAGQVDLIDDRHDFQIIIQR
ncbi:hypothetical protein SDC9_187139 [bioreactor metagenome]|uniref:Uncharacterized protein n=1 Tax=bioreactor metagenome TaxID=1076179 RepID=A0A645HKT0_9ZZZZ